MSAQDNETGETPHIAAQGPSQNVQAEPQAEPQAEVHAVQAPIQAEGDIVVDDSNSAYSDEMQVNPWNP